jgi:3-oxoacyl-[acyl-carrier-protein] synthase-1
MARIAPSVLGLTGNAFEQIQQGKQSIVFAGGGDEVHWSSAVLFDAMRALVSTNNPKDSSIPFAKDRNGFALSGGAGIIVVSDLVELIDGMV